jgi:hypothetical protein
MGTITGDSILARVQKTLFDATGEAYDKNTILFPALLASLRSLASFKENVCPRRAVVDLVAGIVQDIPDDGIAFIKFLWNVMSDGTTPGPAVKTQDLDQHSAMSPNWTTEAASSTIRMALHSESDTTVFYTVPSALNGAKGLILYSAIPTMAVSSDAIPVQDIYENFLYFRTLGHALESQTEKGDLSKSIQFHNRALQELGMGVQAEQVMDGHKPDTGNASPPA